MRIDIRKKIFDYLAEYYDEHMSSTGHVIVEEKLLANVKNLVKYYDYILDVACGTGIFTNILNSHFPHAKGIVGVDISNKMLNEAKKGFEENPKVSFFNINAEKLNITKILSPIDNNLFDLITICYGVCWFDLSKLIKSLEIICKKNSSIIIIDDIDLVQPLFSKYFPKIAKEIDMVRKFKGKNEIERLFVNAGFQKTHEQICPVRNTHLSYIMLLEK